jgi:prepilin peptidase CpaA
LLLLLPFLAIALVTDLSRRQIPNLLIVYMLGFGVVLQAAFSGPSGLFDALAGLVVGLIVLLPFYALGGMGAGDVKLLAAAGTFLGPAGALVAGVCTLVAGAVLALGVLAWQAIAQLVRNRSRHAHVAAITAPTPVARVELPYSVAIVAGTVIAAYNTRLEPVVPWIRSW